MRNNDEIGLVAKAYGRFKQTMMKTKELEAKQLAIPVNKWEF